MSGRRTGNRPAPRMPSATSALAPQVGSLTGGAAAPPPAEQEKPAEKPAPVPAAAPVQPAPVQPAAEPVAEKPVAKPKTSRKMIQVIGWTIRACMSAAVATSEQSPAKTRMWPTRAMIRGVT